MFTSLWKAINGLLAIFVTIWFVADAAFHQGDTRDLIIASTLMVLVAFDQVTDKIVAEIQKGQRS